MAKEKKEKAVTGGEANDLVLKYLKKQNRPYSALDVFNNLGGQVAKANVTKVLAALAEEQLIHHKANGKQMVYVAKQDEYETPARGAIDEMDAKIGMLKEQLIAIKEETRAQQSELNSLSNSLTTDEITSKLAVLETENTTLENRLSTLRSGNSKQPSAEDRKRIDADLEAMRKEWRKRKRMFNDMWGAVTENIQGSLSELRETMGIETDESAGVDINADPLKGLM
ncbi:hypothetical protein HKX48_008389 [Thoreauomyces humboldtii]|nr:hypothetical protein HKX48_008389 [Thoreauomyces humboldtii]